MIVPTDGASVAEAALGPRAYAFVKVSANILARAVLHLLGVRAGEGDKASFGNYAVVGVPG